MSPFAKNLLLILSLAMLGGCNFFPDIRKQPQYHNPFPQIKTVGILPFRNQSQEPTLDADRVTNAYYDAVQSMPGFEVLPVGIIENQLISFEQNVLRRPVSNTQDLQEFAKFVGVDAIIQGSITDYESYYPPRLSLKTNWYAANAGFHPVPIGYGLPWGTKDEKQIPQWIRLEAERALASEQIATQSPAEPSRLPEIGPPLQASNRQSTRSSQRSSQRSSAVILANAVDDPQPTSDTKNGVPTPMQLPEELIPLKAGPSEDGRPHSIIDQRSVSEREPRLGPIASEGPFDSSIEIENSSLHEATSAAGLPQRWPNPQGFVPPPPKSVRPVSTSQSEPIFSYMHTYNGSDGDFTQALSDYYYFRDDGRMGGWEAYLQRSEDFIRFCCHRHVVETVAARGGQLKSRTVVRWPIDRYER